MTCTDGITLSVSLFPAGVGAFQYVIPRNRLIGIKVHHLKFATKMLT